jgi:hypothetical protein
MHLSASESEKREKQGIFEFDDKCRHTARFWSRSAHAWAGLGLCFLTCPASLTADVQVPVKQH